MAIFAKNWSFYQKIVNFGLFANFAKFLSTMAFTFGSNYSKASLPGVEGRGALRGRALTFVDTILDLTDLHYMVAIQRLSENCELA